MRSMSFAGVLDELAGVWASSRIEPHEFIEAGEQVVVPWTAHFQGRDGIEVRTRPTWTFTIRDGAIERICMYQERHEALEAAGLPE
jgi:ketosteroid isomerase-like protein